MIETLILVWLIGALACMAVQCAIDGLKSTPVSTADEFREILGFSLAWPFALVGLCGLAVGAVIRSMWGARR